MIRRRLDCPDFRAPPSPDDLLALQKTIANLFESLRAPVAVAGFPRFISCLTKGDPPDQLINDLLF
jgi:hypothetical protein